MKGFAYRRGAVAWFVRGTVYFGEGTYAPGHNRPGEGRNPCRRPAARSQGLVAGSACMGYYPLERTGWVAFGNTGSCPGPASIQRHSRKEAISYLGV